MLFGNVFSNIQRLGEDLSLSTPSDGCHHRWGRSGKNRQQRVAPRYSGFRAVGSGTRGASTQLSPKGVRSRGGHPVAVEVDQGRSCRFELIVLVNGFAKSELIITF